MRRSWPRVVRPWCLTAALGLAALARPHAALADEALERAVSGAVAQAVDEYRWFHAHPELSGEEDETAAHLAATLRGIGLTVHEGIGGHGIVGVLRSKTGAESGPVVLYRADMDALPIAEATGLPYASENPGVMHACGHDVHMATAVGALRVLAQTDGWRGTVLFVGQPAEEVGRGARAMLADPRWKAIVAEVGTPTVALALHDEADLAAGHVALHEGFHWANVDSIDVVVHGKGGHGARPHETIDPIVIGAEIVMALQTIVSRRLRPGDDAVITVGRFDAGTKHNIIPAKATLLLTVRSYTDEVRATLLAEIERVVRQIAKAHGAPRAPEVTVGADSVPASYNDPAWTERLRGVMRDALGDDRVHDHAPSMGGEDFGLFAKDLGIPAVMWKLGTVDPARWKKARGKGLPGLHSDRFAPAPEPTLEAGIRSVVAAIAHATAPGRS